MQTANANTGIAKCIQLGLFLHSMLGKFPGNVVLAALANTVGGATKNLTGAQDAYAVSVRELVTVRVNVRFADYVSDNVVRAAQRTAETVDGMKNGKVGRLIMPDGVTPIIRPVGATQVKEMRALEGRLASAESVWPGCMAEKAKVEAARIDYETALTKRREAMEQTADLRAKRDAAKEDYLDVYASVAARLKAEFPRNRPMQDLFFDDVRTATSPDDNGDDDEAQPAPTALPATDATPLGSPA